VVTANIEDLSGIVVPHFSLRTGPYWTLVYTIGIRFGGTELEAYIEWTSNVSLRSLSDDLADFKPRVKQ
jgi:hypothetical protein